MEATMKRRLPVVLLALAALLLAAPAGAQRTDSQGNAKVVEVYKDRDTRLYQPLTQSLLVVGNADSSAAIACRGYNFLSINAYVTLPNDSTTKNPVYALISVGVRRGVSASIDTLSAFPRLACNPGSATTVVDTMGSILTLRAGTQDRDYQFLAWMQVDPRVGTDYQPRGRSFDLVDMKTGKNITGDFLSFRFKLEALYDSAMALVTSWRATLRTELVGTQ
jgi:hypothetical protein